MNSNSLGSPSAAQALWLTRRLRPVRQILNTPSHDKSRTDLQHVLGVIQAEVDNLCIEFAALVWAGPLDLPALVPGPSHTLEPATTAIWPTLDCSAIKASDRTQSTESGWDADLENKSDSSSLTLDSSDTSSTTSEPELLELATAPQSNAVPSPKPKPAPKAPTMLATDLRRRRVVVTTRRKPKKPPRRAVNLRNMSKADYKRRFGGAKSGVTKKKGKKAMFGRVATRKDMFRYLADQYFVETKSLTGSGDPIYERRFCACGRCPIFRPICEPRVQKCSMKHAKTRTRPCYFRNKRMDIDRLTSQAKEMYAAAQAV